MGQPKLQKGPNSPPKATVNLRRDDIGLPLWWIAHAISARCHCQLREFAELP